MNTPIKFPYSAKEVRVIMKDDEPWFVATDICAILDIKNATQALERLDDDERSMFNIGRQGDANIVSESGLYALIFSSRKKEAKDFNRWVRKEVLPSIRKTGKYEAPNFQQPEPQQSPELITRDQLNQIEQMVHQIGMCCHTSRSATWNVYAGIRENYGIENIHKLPASQFNTVYGYIHVLSEKAHAYLKMRVAVDNIFCKEVLRKGQLQLEITQQMLLPV